MATNKTTKRIRTSVPQYVGLATRIDGLRSDIHEMKDAVESFSGLEKTPKRDDTATSATRNALPCLVATALTATCCFGASTPAAAQTPAEAACRSAIATSTTKYVTSVLKKISDCHRQRSSGKLALLVDCNQVSQADPDGQLEGRRNDLRARVGGSDECAEASGLLGTQYARCPAPGNEADDGGATDGIDGFNEVAECMIALAEGMAQQIAARSLGFPQQVLDPGLAACQREMAKRVTKLVAAYGRERGACQRQLDSQASGLAYGCHDADPRGRIAKAAATLKERMALRCDPADPQPRTEANEVLDLLNACGDTLEQLLTCTPDVVAAQAGAGLVAAAYDLPAQCRAGGVVRTLRAPFGSRITSTRFDAGANGLAHGIEFNDDFRDPMLLDCDPDCADCQITYNVSKTQTVPPCRCANDASKPCDTLNGPDQDDCGLVANQCNCHFSPPLAVAAAGAPVCVPIYILSDYEGTVNLGTGSWDNPLHVAAVIHLGGTSDEPCPLCMGDTVKDDGVRDGTCSSGIRIGGACDVNGYHPTWGPISIDCQPVSGANISGQGLVLNFPLTSGTSVLESTLPCDNPSDRLCPCRVCSGSDQIGCRNDAECAAAGAGTCTGTAGIGVSPNGCSDFNCGPDGTCPAGPVDQFCDGKVHPSGRGYVTCTTNADCQALDAGTCSIEQRRRCFLDPLVAVGKAGLFESDLAGQACLGATTSIAINAASGLPGPVNVDVFNEYHATCAVDSSVTWEPPTGANCLTAGTTLPPQACADSFPLCGGACPPGLECAMDGLTCTCQPPVTTTTTTMPPAPCNETFPLCGGQCPLGQTCTLGLVTCNCQ